MQDSCWIYRTWIYTKSWPQVHIAKSVFFFASKSRVPLLCSWLKQFGLLLTDSFHRGKHGLHTHLVATGMSIVFSQWFWSWFVDLVGAKKDFCAQSSKLDVDCGMENLITKSSVQLQLQKNKRRPHILMFFCYFFVRLSHQVACKEVQMPLKEILNKQVGSKT